VALVKQSALARAQAGKASVVSDWAANDDNRASIKSERGTRESGTFFVGEGAHSLSIRSREKLLNRCAPVATNASSEVGYVALELGENRHAASATTSSEVPATSPCSSADKEEVLNGCADMTPADDDPSTALSDFYEIKTDLFDNTGRGKKTSIHRAKLMIRAEPTTSAKDADVFMLDFFNRTRDINKRLKEMEMDNDAWYLAFRADFDRYDAMLMDWMIKPKLAVLKELIKDDGSSEIIGYAAGIMFQIRNQAPVVMLYYGGSVYELALDFEFNRTQGSAIYKKGIYRDPSRQHLDCELGETKKKFKIKSQKDFN
jgi:hypothetical protein